MAYSAELADRLRQQLATRPGISERRMFGGLAFMAHGHMAVGIVGNTLMARIGPAAYAAALQRPHVRVMDFTGRPMKGYVYIDPPGIASDAGLGFWIAASLDFVVTLPVKTECGGRIVGKTR